MTITMTTAMRILFEIFLAAKKDPSVEEIFLWNFLKIDLAHLNERNGEGDPNVIQTGLQCDQIWRNFATLEKINVFVQFLGWLIWYLANVYTNFGIFMLLGKFSFL